MKKIIPIVLFFIGFLTITPLHGQEKNSHREFSHVEGDTTYIMKEYYLLMYLRGEKANDYSKSELDSIQDLHMNHINKLADNGFVIIAGPMGDDTDLRGILIFDTNSLEEAKVLGQADPAVNAGRLKIEVHPWWAAKGSTLK